MATLAPGVAAASNAEAARPAAGGARCLSPVSFICFALARARGEEEKGVGVVVIRPSPAARAGPGLFSRWKGTVPRSVAGRLLPWLHRPCPRTRAAAPLCTGRAALPEARRLPAGISRGGLPASARASCLGAAVKPLRARLSG